MMAKSNHTKPRERRTVERFAFRCPVDISTDDIQLRGQLLNLSATGALIALPAEISLGSEVKLRIELPGDGPPLELFAMVIRKTSNHPLRLGVTFILPPPEVVARIRGLIYETK